MKQLVFTLLVFGAVGRCQTPLACIDKLGAVGRCQTPTLDDNYYLNSVMPCVGKAANSVEPLNGKELSSVETRRRLRAMTLAGEECEKPLKRAIRDRFDGCVDDTTGGHRNGCWWRNNDKEAKFNFLEGFIAGQPVPLSTVELMYAKHLSIPQIADLLDIYYHDAVNLTTPLFAAVKIVAPAL
jgi:hypothetical protein